MNSVFLNDLNIHSSWQPFLTGETHDLLLQVESDIAGNDFTPSKEKVLRFLELPLHTVKVVILGQDPYPQPGVATGRAFEVGTLKSWSEPFRNISLKNILRALYKAYSGEVLKYNEIKSKFDNEFPVLPPNQLFKHWEQQGVLLLNTSFTCEPGKPGSHKHIWSSFTLNLLEFLNSKGENITWFLWGNHASEAVKELEIKHKLVSQHPMMCYDKEGRKTDFLYGEINCFKVLQNEIDWTGYQLEKKEFQTGKTLF